ncbi:hypothetical protein COV24_02275 [candidate division WWE3 bacterium CG10_big_fil_rev_8_21_14_0_10_32_10]|uniref:Uncharacterized protein n=1 Tax=candidate division WWE3 bacterium CG10_big_fil_rev_8_21_14_0_10_32_10 TaxID=1975090 RepID=A0A2H0RBV8_UNCKA|nr:MAG: hypothetical protein COV24_02275 [candidate division WWE3 bacterium CG10_big_fil_rev_8_21_14_0_10_32_10]
MQKNCELVEMVWVSSGPKIIEANKTAIAGVDLDILPRVKSRGIYNRYRNYDVEVQLLKKSIVWGVLPGDKPDSYRRMRE